MKTVIISYSATGNNYKIAEYISKRLKIDHVDVTEPIKKFTFGIMFKHLFNKTPKVNPEPNIIDKYDYVILCAPIWMGKAAAPMRAYFSYLNKKPHKYAFVSASGGSREQNPRAETDMINRVGYKPNLVDVLSLSKLCQNNNTPVKNIMEYRITDEDIEKIAKNLISDLGKLI